MRMRMEETAWPVHVRFLSQVGQRYYYRTGMLWPGSTVQSVCGCRARDVSTGLVCDAVTGRDMPATYM